MIDKIENIEKQMMEPKKWLEVGEVQCAERGKNTLLDEYLDFDQASKMAPQITQETTNQIEAMIRQRVMDEMFDDPIRRVIPDANKNLDDFEIDFTKSKKGLDGIYEEEY